MYQSHSYDSAFLLFGKSSAPTAASPQLTLLPRNMIKIPLHLGSFKGGKPFSRTPAESLLISFVV